MELSALAASVGSQIVSGIPWEKLTTPTMPGIYNPFYISNYLAPQLARTAELIAQIQLPEWNEKESLDSVKVVYDLSKSMVANIESIATSAPMEVTNEKYRAFVAQAWYTASYGAQLHIKGVIHTAIKAGNMTEAEAMRHADNCYRTLQAIVMMKQNGGFKTLNGLGEIVLSTSAIVLIGILAIIVAATIIWILDGSSKNQLLRDLCDKAKTQDEKNACIAAAGSGPGSVNLNAAFSNLGPYLIVAALGVSAIYFFPRIMEGVATYFNRRERRS